MPNIIIAGWLSLSSPGSSLASLERPRWLRLSRRAVRLAICSDKSSDRRMPEGSARRRNSCAGIDREAIEPSVPHCAIVLNAGHGPAHYAARRRACGAIASRPLLRALHHVSRYCVLRHISDRNGAAHPNRRDRRWPPRPCPLPWVAANGVA